jgi:hypothetical protein
MLFGEVAMATMGSPSTTISLTLTDSPVKLTFTSANTKGKVDWFPLTMLIQPTAAPKYRSLLLKRCNVIKVMTAITPVTMITKAIRTKTMTLAMEEQLLYLSIKNFPCSCVLFS